MGVKITHKPQLNYQALMKGIPDTMRKAGAYLKSSADRRIKAGVAPANSPLTAKVKSGNQTLRDSGDLARSIAAHSGPLWADASSNKKQARLLQEGGVIRPKKAKALWIPAGPETRRLMKHYGAKSPGELIRILKADNYGGFITPLSKVYCMYKKAGKGKNGRKIKEGKPFMLFIVRSSVTIPARPFLKIEKKDEEFLLNLIRAGIQKELGKKHDCN